MKCEVCGTEIPTGEVECPECGNKLEVTHQEIVQTKKRNDHNKKALLICGSIILIILIYVLAAYDFAPRSSGPIERLTYQQTIDRGYDDGSIQVAIDKQKDVEEFIYNALDLQNIKSSQYCLSDGNTTIVCFYVEGMLESNQYSISYSVVNKQLKTSRLEVYGTNNKSIQTLSNIPIDETIMNKMGDYIEINQAYSLLNKAREKMAKDKNDQKRYIYINQENPEISIIENQESESEYSFNVSIDIDYSKINKNR